MLHLIQVRTTDVPAPCLISALFMLCAFGVTACEANTDRRVGVCRGGFCVGEPDTGADADLPDALDTEDGGPEVEDADTGADAGDVTATPPSPVVDLALGSGHTCAALADGTVWCWGVNQEGQLGIGEESFARSRPTRVRGLSSVVEVASGPAARHTCARTKSGELYCWGSNWAGALGLGNGCNEEQPSNVRRPRRVPGLPLIREVRVGSLDTCAGAEGGTLYCWGSNQYGQLGSESEADCRATPVKVDSTPMLQSVHPAMNFSCGVSEAGEVYCWGNNNYGQLGDKTIQPRSSPAPVKQLQDVAQLDTGKGHSCAILESDRLKCWGANHFQQLGGIVREHLREAGARLSDLPVEVIASEAKDPLEGVASVAAGRLHTCARMKDGSVRCWGDYASGQLGQGRNLSTSYGITLPQRVPTIENARQLDAGDAHTCAVIESGEVVCWGANGQGQIGVGTQTTVEKPVEVLW